MPAHARLVLDLQIHAARHCQSELVGGIGHEGGDGQHDAIVPHGDQPGIECGIQVRGEQETIEHVQALDICGHRPRFGMAGAQQLGHGQASDSASAALQCHQAC